VCRDRSTSWVSGDSGGDSRGSSQKDKSRAKNNDPPFFEESGVRGRWGAGGISTGRLPAVIDPHAKLVAVTVRSVSRRACEEVFRPVMRGRIQAETPRRGQASRRRRANLFVFWGAGQSPGMRRRRPEEGRTNTRSPWFGRPCLGVYSGRPSTCATC